MFSRTIDPATGGASRSGTVVGERVVELDRERERVNAAYLAALGELAAGGLHEVDGAVSAAGWVAHRCEVSGARARSEVRTATGLRSMPHVAEALGDGGLCVAKVELLAKARAGVDAGLFADHEEHLVATIAGLTVDHAAQAVRYWLACALAETERDGDPGERLRERRRLHLSPTLDGTWKLDATLGPEVGARIKATIDARYDDLRRNEEPDARLQPGQRRADALADLLLGGAGAEPDDSADRDDHDDASDQDHGDTADHDDTAGCDDRFGVVGGADQDDSAQQDVRGGGGDDGGQDEAHGSPGGDPPADQDHTGTDGTRPGGSNGNTTTPKAAKKPWRLPPPAPDFTMAFDADALLDGRDVLGELAAGIPLFMSAGRRLLCNCTLSAVVFHGTQPIDLGRQARLPTRAQRRALAIRDDGCRFPGCDRDLRWCDAHHILHWLDHGPTDIDNLVLLCRYHHHLVHEGGFTLTGLVSEGLEFRRPDGSLITSPRTGPPSLFHLPTTRPPPKPPPFAAA